MADRGVYFDPNFLVLHNYLDNKPKFLGIGNYTEEGFAAMEKALPLVADVLKRARRHNVKVVLGTDGVAGAHGRNARAAVSRLGSAFEYPDSASTLPSGMEITAAAAKGRWCAASESSTNRCKPGLNVSCASPPPSRSATYREPRMVMVAKATDGLEMLWREADTSSWAPADRAKRSRASKIVKPPSGAIRARREGFMVTKSYM